MKLLTLFSRLAFATPADWDTPPEPVELTAQERAALEQGETVYRSDLEREGSSGLSMVLVEADRPAVWETILDFDSYVLFLPYVTASWGELDQHRSDGPRRLRWGMELTTKGVTTRYAVECRYRSQSRYMTWEMLPVGASPMERARGFWMTQPWPDDPSRTLLVYSVDVRTAWWLPLAVHEKAASRGLPATVALFGRRAEAVHPSGLAGD